MSRDEGAAREIQTLVEAWLNAVRSSDLDAIMAHYAPGVIAYDAIMALQFKGAAAYRDHWQACLAMCTGPMTFEIHDLAVVAEGDTGFAHGLVRCGGPDETGEVRTSWMRMSGGYRRSGGRWHIVHEHFSAPFEPQSGKAIFDATP